MQARSNNVCRQTMKPKKILVWFSLLVLANQVNSDKRILMEKPDLITKEWHWKVLKGAIGSGFTHPSHEKQYYFVCDVLTPEQPENWLVVDFIEAKDAKRVFIQFFYTIKICPSKSNICKTEFYLYVHHSKSKDDLINPMKTPFTQLSTISPAGLVDEDNMYNFTYSVAVKHIGVYFAIFDTGSCFVIRRVVISYNFCAAKEQGKLVAFPGTVAPFNDSQPVYVEGTCLDKNSANTTRLIAMCTSSGQWKKSGNVDCLCKPGYGFAADAKGNNKCEACPSNRYKSLKDNSACQSCPRNSLALPNKTSCFCHNGFYKLAQDAIKPCEGLPSAVAIINIIYNNSTALTLQWPVEPNVWYTINYSRCEEEGECLAPCEDAKYVPELDNIKGDRVTVGGLKPSTTYKLKVYSVNELNNLEPDKKKWKSSSVTQKTNSLPDYENSVEPPKNGGSNNWMVIVITILAIALFGLLLFGVIIYTRRQRKRKLKRRRGDRGDQSRTLELSLTQYRDENREATTSFEDDAESSPRIYEEATRLTRERDAKSWEFPREKLELIKMLGSGNFGEVFKGMVYTEVHQLGTAPIGIRVAVKVLKQDANAQGKKDFLSELTLMKSLTPNPYVVSLLGCCTVSGPAMLILEYLPFGDLLGYLRGSRGHNDEHWTGELRPKSSLSSDTLCRFAFMIAEGMSFLAKNKCVHRDLAARNVLVGENNICKVSDFGLARSVGNAIYERKSKSRLPIKWMPPESIFFAVSSTKSDVWSYGIVLWEIFTIGTTPYPTHRGREVPELLLQGYRMHKPAHLSDELYSIMADCWRENPEARPTFQKLSLQFGKISSDMETYINLDAFEPKLYSNFEDL